jgi:SAM-dependent methyltransferase
MDDQDTVIELARRLREALAANPDFSDEGFDRLCREWHGCVDGVKQAAFNPDWRNKHDPRSFEYGWGAQSAQFVIDLVPRIQAVLHRHYKRKDVLRLIDVGAGSCVGTQVLAMLHSDHYVYSRFEIDAIDYLPLRERWVRSQYPRIAYQVGDAFALPERTWDFVVCSHVVEHLDDPRPFIDNLRRICRGFAFVYSPYRELERIPDHFSTIDESTYAGIPGCELEVVSSMGWHPDRPGDECLIATIDCREPASPG